MTDKAQRFWARVDCSPGPTACWSWQGACDGCGYGRLERSTWGEKRTHRMAYVLAVGSVPTGKCVLHTCDNPPCCNPAHLFIGTPADNARDRMRKGRGGSALIRGAANGRAKLTTAQVIALRATYAAGLASQRTLAVQYGIGQSQVSRLVCRRQRKYEG